MASATRLGYRRQARLRASWAADEPHPTLMRTLAARPRRAGRLCRGTSPGRSRYAFVPGSVATRIATGSLPNESVPLGRAHGRGGSSGVSFRSSGAPRRGSGEPWDGASAPSPFTWDSLVLSPFGPRPTAAAPPVLHRESEVAGTAGVPSKRPAAGAGAEATRIRSRGPVTTGGHRRGGPRVGSR